MKPLIIVTVLSLMTFAIAASGDDVLPATTEDIDAFSSTLAQSRGIEPSEGIRPASPSKPTNNFGAFVSGEAKKLKESGDLGGSKNFGQMISNERRHNFDRPGAGHHSENDATSEARDSASKKQHDSDDHHHGHDHH